VGDADALADATIALLQDASRREHMAGAARAWALAHDAEWTAGKFEEIYAEVSRGNH
jgi:hypothetical protein